VGINTSDLVRVKREAAADGLLGGDFGHTATSSSPVAMSSSNVSRLEATLSLGAENAAPKRFSEQRHQART
jgi:hypothetical protein